MRLASYEIVEDDRFGARPADDPALTRPELERLISQLTENRRVVVTLRLEGHDYSQIAEILGVPESTVRKRMFDALKQIRDALAQSHMTGRSSVEEDASLGEMTT